MLTWQGKQEGQTDVVVRRNKRGLYSLPTSWVISSIILGSISKVAVVVILVNACLASASVIEILISNKCVDGFFSGMYKEENGENNGWNGLS